MKYLLMDLERTIGNGVVHYWKGNRYGYTTDPKEAGRFSEEEANRSVKSDFNERTVMIAESVVDGILK